MEVLTISLKNIVLVHWLLTIWACFISWLPTSYVLANVSALAVGVWAIAQKDSIDAILMFLIGLAVTILTDIVHFALYYAAAEIQYKSVAPDLFRFSGGLAITSLMLKPVSCLYAYHVYRVRGGENNFSFRFPWITRNREYQTFDHQDQPGSSANNQAEGGKPGPSPC
ncbi:type-1 angiotensin II receptor-associated protein-like [Carassius carassius]|uniref:type-1 angiotensin II receptor-associated protein-like n=1 Tax=Carassius carassius TaxID=217509 RepID=UPI002868BBED|nr:type-1 angiotensin II receptor-associated protein-like [Carassius carassius]